MAFPLFLRWAAREERVLHAARDLATDLPRSGGEDSPEVEHSRAEIARLRG